METNKYVFFGFTVFHMGKVVNYTQRTTYR